MTYDKKFQIDKTIIDILEKKQIEFRTILKSTIQFILTLELEFKENMEQILLEVIEKYRDYTMIPLSNSYKAKSSFFTKEQDNVYNSISSEKRKYIINELMSIAINNSSYINVINKKIEIKQDNIINEFTLKYFLAFKKEEIIYQEMIITIMKSLLFKGARLLNKSLLVDSYYKELLTLIMEQCNLKNDAYEYLMNPHIAEFINEELGKIFFIMNIEYNMSLKDESENFRKWKSKYEPILENKYKNSLSNFIQGEFNFPDIDIEIQIEEFYNFLDGIHPTAKEKTLIHNTWTKMMQNLLING